MTHKAVSFSSLIFMELSAYVYTNFCVWFGLVWFGFFSISTVVGYLMSKPFVKNSNS